MSFNEDNHYLPASHKFQANPLLNKSIVGHTRGSLDPLPGGEDAIYGRPNIQTAEGAGEVVHHWKTHTPNPEAVAHRDFVKTNRMAASQGCTTAKANTRYRHSHMYRQKKSTVVDKQNADKGFHKKLQGQTFGMRNKASEPIKYVVMNQYQAHWIQGQKNILQKKPKSRHGGVRQYYPPSIQHSGTAGERHEREPFKMKQFANVKSRVAVPEKGWYKGIEQKQRDDEKRRSSLSMESVSEAASTAAESLQDNAVAES